VPEIVEAYVGKYGTLEERLEMLVGDVARIEWCADLGGEDEVVIRPPSASP
jgi:hypothetical protein